MMKLDLGGLLDVITCSKSSLPDDRTTKDAVLFGRWGCEVLYFMKGVTTGAWEPWINNLAARDLV
jgi:hypothetical protein